MNTIIIDDDHDILSIYNGYLTELGYPEATLVPNPKQFFETNTVKSLVTNFDLVVCDVHMPHMKGNEILKNFVQHRRSEKQYPTFIMITGVPPEYFSFDEQGWGSLAAADDILGKPVDIEEFDSALKRQGFFGKTSA